VLKKLRVTNFKVIADSTLLPLQPFTVLIGRNGSGKSSLLEALDWLGQAVSDDLEIATDRFQRISDVIHRFSNEKRTFGITLVFDPQDISAGDEITYRLEIGMDETGQSPRVVSEELIASMRDGDDFLIRTVSEGVREYRVKIRVNLEEADSDTDRDQADADENKRPEDEERNDENTRRQSAKKVPEEDWRPVTDTSRLALSFVDPIEIRAGKLLRDFLAQAVYLRLDPRAIAGFTPARIRHSSRLLDDEGTRLAALLETLDTDTREILIEKLRFILTEASDLVSHKPLSPADRRYFSLIENREGDTQEVPAWVLSEGTRRMTALMAILLHPMPPPLLCVEEIENGFDPWTLKFIIEELAGAIDRGMQVLATTHSPYLLDMVGHDNIILCDRATYGVEFVAGEQLPDESALQKVLGLGALYTNRYLYRKEE
jgi:predicted ATPase